MPTDHNAYDGQDDQFSMYEEIIIGDDAIQDPIADGNVTYSTPDEQVDVAAIADCTDSLTPLIERAAVTCEALRESCRLAVPSDQGLRRTLAEVHALLERADKLMPALEFQAQSVAATIESATKDATQAARAGRATEMRELIYESLTSMRQELEGRAATERQRIDRLEHDLAARISQLNERMNGVAQEHTPSQRRALDIDRDAIDSAIDDAIGVGVTRTLSIWERETVQLMNLFRARVERAISSVDAAAAERSRQLDQLCSRADRIFAQSGGDPASLTSVVGELVESIRPWRGLLVEGKCSPDLEPLVTSIVERVRGEIRGDLDGRLDKLDATMSDMLLRTPAPSPTSAAVGSDLGHMEHFHQHTPSDPCTTASLMIVDGASDETLDVPNTRNAARVKKSGSVVARRTVVENRSQTANRSTTGAKQTATKAASASPRTGKRRAA